MILGIQLYGLFSMERNKWKNEQSLFQALRDMGIRKAEPCVTFSEGKEEGKESVEDGPFWSPAKFGEMLPLIREAGLRIESVHIASDDLLKDADRVAELARKAGLRFVVLQTPTPYTDENLQQAAFAVRSFSEKLAGAGVRVLLHNGGADILEKVHGRTAYEYFADICSGAVGLQVDVGWVAAGGEDPVDFLRKNEARIESLHFKDFEKPGTSETDTFIGGGAVDTDLCMQFGRAKGIPLYIDQDHCENFPEDCKKSYDKLMSAGQCREHTVSYLNVLDTETGSVQVLKKFDDVVEAPNWVGSLNSLVYNADGHLYRFDLETKKSTLISTGSLSSCNNDHVVSSDAKEIAISCWVEKNGVGGSYIFKLPLSGGEPQPVTDNAPSYLHGWSPDKKDMVYCAFRNVDGVQHVDVYSIPAEGGTEKRLTTEGFNDGPEYSPDGKHIWYISTRTGLMQCYRMNADGSEQQQMTFEDQNNWFAHVSPDGKKAVNIAYKAGESLADEHLPNMHVALWLMNADGSERRKILSFFGGQGSINVNSWAPDSRHLAFVSYDVELEH